MICAHGVSDDEQIYSAMSKGEIKSTLAMQMI